MTATSLTPLKRVAKVRYGLGQPPPESPGGIPILRATNIHRGRIVPDGMIFARREDLPLERAPLLQEGEILVVRSGAYTGDSALITDEWAGAAPGYDLRLTPIEVEPRFLAYVLLSRHATDQIWLAKARAAQPHLNAEDLGELRLFLPDVRIQRSIADFLDSETVRIDGLVARKHRQLALLEERLLAAIAIAAPPARQTETAPALKRVIESVVGGSWGDEPGDGELDARCIRGTDFDMRTLSVNVESAPIRSFGIKELASRQLRAGDLIVEKSGGGDTQPVGRVVRWLSEERALPTNFAARLRPLPSTDCGYLAYVFRSAYERGITRAWIKQTTGIQNLDLAGFLSERWFFPGRSEQEEIATHLDAEVALIREVQNRLHRQLRVIHEHRQALITAAVTGELKVA